MHSRVRLALLKGAAMVVAYDHRPVLASGSAVLAGKHSALRFLFSIFLCALSATCSSASSALQLLSLNMRCVYANARAISQQKLARWAESDLKADSCWAAFKLSMLLRKGAVNLQVCVLRRFGPYLENTADSRDAYHADNQACINQQA